MPGFEEQPRLPLAESLEPRQVTTRHTFRVDENLYDVHKLIGAAEGLPVEIVPLSIFAGQEDETACWTDKKDKLLGPKQLLDLAAKYDADFNAMILANIDWAQHIVSVRDADYEEYPLLVVGDNNVIDGMHRLTRAWINKETEIKIRRFDKIPPEAEIKE